LRLVVFGFGLEEEIHLKRALLDVDGCKYCQCWCIDQFSLNRVLIID
jgi:hypothetical protein